MDVGGGCYMQQLYIDYSSEHDYRCDVSMYYRTEVLAGPVLWISGTRQFSCYYV